MTFRVGTISILLVSAIAASLPATGPAAAEDVYKGRKLNLIVGFGAGGGIDTIARIFARHLVNHIDGAPTLVVQNQPGAAGVNALNQLYRAAPKDGSVVAYDTWTPLSVVTKSKGIQFDYAKLTLIGALRTGTYVMFARNDVLPGGLKRAADIIKAKELVYAGQQPTLGLDVHGRVALDLLMKGKYKYVSGYRSAPAIRLALERGEANVTTHGLQGYRAGVEPRYIKSGAFVPLWHFPRRDDSGAFVDDPDVKDMPSLLTVYKEAFGKMPSGIEWQAVELLSDLHGTVANFIWGPPGMDEKAVAALRKAFYATTSDPAFLAELDKVFGFRYQPVSVETARKVIAKLDNVDPKLVAFFQALMK
jgi:tripartite-type tricarboxylate transporter receptor subunit TctC